MQEALQVLGDLGMPRAQRNERSALCLLALLDLTPDKPWTAATGPLMGITPIMEWVRRHYAKPYAPNTRETFRRQTMHQFVQAGIVTYNPDRPDRPVNSPHAVYQIEPACLDTLRTLGTGRYTDQLAHFLAIQGTLAARHAMPRSLRMVPLRIGTGTEVLLSPGKHSALIKALCEEFGPRFVPGGELVYAGDAGNKWGYCNERLLATLGVTAGAHGKMPDVMIYDPQRRWLILAEAVTSHGPVDAKRRQELDALFGEFEVGLVFVSAFPDRRTFNKYQEAISWESEVWIADHPSHLIHFDGTRFLGPYPRP
ncbi:BsuBI/PstI family type II restriction endonuclease [Acidiferrobacter sp.]